MRKPNNMSIAIHPELKERLEVYAKRKKDSTSKVIRDLIERYFVEEDDVIPVILKIPVKLKGDVENLKKWLEVKVGAITNALSGQP